MLVLLAMFSFLFILSLRFFGYSLKFKCIHLFDLSIDGLSFSAPTYSLSIGKLSLRLAFKTSWAVVSAYNCHCQDSDSIVTLERGFATIWFFPVFFRQTAGPWITTTLDGFSVKIFTSQTQPRWIQLLRNNMIYTLLDGDTIRLDNLKTRIQFSTLTGAPNGYTGSVEKPGSRQDEPHDEIKLHVDISQWHIVNVRRRMYTYGNVHAIITRNWVDDQGSLAISSEGSKWTKVPAVAQMEAYRKSSTLGQIFHSVYSFPSEVFKILKDPLCTIDLDVPRCDVTFDNFRIRDAELLKQGVMKVRRDYLRVDAKHPGFLKEFTWDMVLYGISKIWDSDLQEDKTEQDGCSVDRSD